MGMIYYVSMSKRNPRNKAKREDRKMLTLEAKVLEALFVTEGYKESGEPIKQYCSYPVYEFDNGLILVPSDSTNDYFFPSESEIQGCGLDCYTGYEDTGETVSFTKKQLADTWGNSTSEFGINKEVVHLVRQLLFGKRG